MGAVSIELPDIEQPVSYVVDDGEAVGPMPLRSIAQSIADGERRSDVLVWWIGATEWIRFNSTEELVALLAVPAFETPEIPEPVELVEEAEPVAPLSRDEPIARVEISPADDLAAIEEVDLREDVAPSPTDVDDLDEIPVSADPVLAQLGARLEALSSATRHSAATSQLDRAGAPAIERPTRLDVEAVIVPEESPSIIRSSTLATTFDGLVRQTVAYERLAEQSNRVSELLARACAASLTRHGYTVDRSTETPGHHHLVFTGGVDTRRVRLDVSPAPSVGDDAQHIFVGMSWGRMAFDIDEAVRVVHRQLPVSSRNPGIISADAELDSGSVFTRIELVWPVEDYVGADFLVDHQALESALDATQQMLETRWYELFIPAE